MSDKKNRIKRIGQLLCVAVLLAANPCCTRHTEPQVEGHYTYQHAFEYDLDGNHFDVSETGTMDFFCDSSALDSARQVYNVTLEDGDSAIIVFNYVSPSRWRLENKDFYFAGIRDCFQMEMIFCLRHSNQPGTVEDSVCNIEAGLAQRIINVISGSIDYEYKFHLDTLTAERLQWSFTYRDGHSDTWTFNRQP